MWRTATIALGLAFLAGCGGESGADEDGATRRSATAPDRGGVLRGGPPDAGTATGHGADAARRTRVEVPAADRTPPEAFLRVEGIGPGRAPLAARASSAQWPRGERVRLGAPRVRATAVARDTGGMARIRISIEERVVCVNGATGTRRERLRHRYLPPPAIARIRVPPGVDLPAERTRRARLRLGHGVCAGGPWRQAGVSGRLWADATNAHERESSALIHFVH